MQGKLMLIDYRSRKEKEIMPTKQDIILAIGLQMSWINQFENAISNGWTILGADLANRSYQSHLGSWLSERSTSERDSEYFRTVQSLNAEFHEAAANVLRIASIGKVRLAEASIHTGPYANASIALTLALRDWMDAVKEDGHIHAHHLTQ